MLRLGHPVFVKWSPRDTWYKWNAADDSEGNPRKAKGALRTAAATSKRWLASWSLPGWFGLYWLGRLVCSVRLRHPEHSQNKELQTFGNFWKVSWRCVCGPAIQSPGCLPFHCNFHPCFVLLCMDMLFDPAAFGLRPRIDVASRDAFALRELNRERHRRVAHP